MATQQSHTIFRDGPGYIADIYNPATGRGVYSGLTIDELNSRRGPGHRVVSAEEAVQLQAAADRDRYCKGAVPITAERFDQALNCLPPECWTGGGGGLTESFRLSERLAGPIASFFLRIGQRFWQINEDERTTHAELVEIAMLDAPGA